MHIRCVAVSQGSKTYILRSTLDPALIERAALTNKRIFEVEAADAPDDVDDAEPGTRTYGSLIAWNSADQLSALGILYVILALILVNGKVISDSASHRTVVRERAADMFSQWTCACFFAACASARQHKSLSQLTHLTAHSRSTHTFLSSSAKAISIARASAPVGPRRNAGEVAAQARRRPAAGAAARRMTWSGSGAGARVPRRRSARRPVRGSLRSSWRSARAAEALAGVVVREEVPGVALVVRMAATRRLVGAGRERIVRRRRRGSRRF